MKDQLKKSAAWAKKYWILLTGLAVVLIWCIPYITSGNGIEWGDFSFFAQGYEAIRITIQQYGQFPWWNPWMSGGIPLYANPQMGVFSLQTIFVLLFGTVEGLKIAIVFYTVVGYLSMFVLLTRYFKVRMAIAVPLSIAWVTSSFFVAHLPSHFTFVWYLLAPLFVYVSLVVRTWRGGIVLGSLFAIMALSAVHNPFFQIGLVCAAIILVRLALLIWKRKEALKSFIFMSAAAAATLLVVAGHRLYFAYQNVSSFDRPTPSDPSIQPLNAPYAVFMPFDRSDYISGAVIYPPSPFSWGEATSSGGIILTVLFFLACAFIFYILFKQKIRRKYKTILLVGLAVVAIALFFFLLGIGNFAKLSPYNFLKHLPVFGEMRVSTRWFLWVTLAMIILVGFILSLKSKFRIAPVLLCLLVVVELFALNFGSQSDVLSHKPITAPLPASSYTFRQIDEFGSQHEFEDGLMIPDDKQGPLFYREYEATTYNIGVIRANEPLVNNRYEAVRCVEDKGCSYILSNNATLKQWTPNKLVIERTGGGDIILNINASRYVKVNGIRTDSKKVGDTYANILITSSDKEIIVTYTPDFK